MKVALNIFPLSSIHQTRGVGFYTKYLVEELKKIKGIELQEFSKLEEVKNVDVIHYPYFDLFYHTLKIHPKIPTVVTIHDVTPLVFPKHYPPGIRGKINFLLQKKELKKISGVITDSHASKRDLPKYLPLKWDDIYVTYLSYANHFKVIKNRRYLNEVSKRYRLPERFALFTGNVNWNKNIVNLTQACIDAKIDLFLVGKSFEDRDDLNHAEMRSFKQFLQKLSEHPLVHTLGFVSDEDLTGLMNLSSVVLLPSFYEGFGITILEAQACGTPVITSHLSSMTEVAGDAALYVDPYSVKSITEAIERLSLDEKLPARLKKRGFENIKRFSWKKTALETLAVYDKILS